MTSPSERAPLERRLPGKGVEATAELLLERFMAYSEERGLELYPAQEEAILELFDGHNVILKTPTGSGKSLVALAACYKALAERKFAFYTAPIKALVTEKFFELCRVLGADNVGMMTGDAAVNTDAPIICCTAEILANLALREGARAQADMVVMDEFHYYADRDRGSAWQLPLLTLTQARFLLMSATLGQTDFFLRCLEDLTGIPTRLVSSAERPVPLDFSYSEVPVQDKILSLNENGLTPIYIVHFSQRAACEAAQNLMSCNFIDKERKRAIADQLKGFRFDSPFGKELSRFVRHGVGVHHAGMLPKYRRLVERLAQSGLLSIICGTDTLGVGVNVPIRTVLFTQLCKFDGDKTKILTVRDFHQIAGRAGRRGFDTRGSVVVQAPEHEIENRIMRDKAADNPKKLKKLRSKKPPDRGYSPYDAQTMQRLIESEPEALVPQFRVNQGMLLNVLAGEDGCRRAKALVRGCHEPPAGRRRLLKRGMDLFRSLVTSGVLELTSEGVQINADLQQDFSLHQALSLWAHEVLDTLDPELPTHPLTVLSVLEATLETPYAVIYKQIDALKKQRLAELKAEGVPYEERLEELERIEAPKPEADFIYGTYNLFKQQHPWVAEHNIAPKSIARDMYEQAASFNVYVKDYGLSRLEGVLLRYLSDVYRALRQSVAEQHKTAGIAELEDWLGAELRAVDASLIDEWEQLQHPQTMLERRPQQPANDDITQDAKAFDILLRNASFRLVQALARRDFDRAIRLLSDMAGEDAKYPKDPKGDAWTPERLAEALAPYFQEHDYIAVDGNARSAARSTIERTPARTSLRQTLSDPADNLDWYFELSVDLAASAEASQVVASLTLVTVEP